nr:7564_t:CDS:2 [Entrophospora candida]
MVNEHESSLVNSNLEERITTKMILIRPPYPPKISPKEILLNYINVNPQQAFLNDNNFNYYYDQYLSSNENDNSNNDNNDKLIDISSANSSPNIETPVINDYMLPSPQFINDSNTSPIFSYNSYENYDTTPLLYNNNINFYENYDFNFNDNIDNNHACDY